MPADDASLSSIPQPPVEGVELAPGVRVPADAIRIRFVRARGPGGQNVNKVSTACELRIDLAALASSLSVGAMARLRAALGSRVTAGGEIQLVSDEFRSQERNREALFERLRDWITRARVEPKPRKKTKPSKASQRRRVEGKRRRGAIKGGRRAGFDD